MCSSTLSVNCEYADTWVRSIPAEEKILFVPAADAAVSRAPQSATPRPLGANTLAQFVYPAQPVLKKAASRIGRSATRLVYPAQPMQGNWLTYLA